MTDAFSSFKMEYIYLVLREVFLWVIIFGIKKILERGGQAKNIVRN